MADQKETDHLSGRIEDYRWKLRHLNGPVNHAEKAELESEFVEIVRIARERTVR